MKILVVDIGGTHVKLLASGQEEPRKCPSGRDLTPQQMIALVRQAARDWTYDVVTVGYPGPVVHGRPTVEPANLGKGWLAFDFAAAFGKPVKVINDAAMQALGSYEEGRMLFLGLGTGMGSALVVDGTLAPLELGHLPYRKHLFEHYVGARGLERFGKQRWRTLVFDVVARLQRAMQAEYVVLGGGNVKKLKELPEGCRAGDNRNAFVGGFRLWEGDRESHPTLHPPSAPAG